VTGLCLFATGMCPTLMVLVVTAITGGNLENEGIDLNQKDPF